ncbi:MAG: hypothetical protein ACI4S3_07375 [Candidatus Gastranaerophilaceae bacterium]
MEKNSKNQKEEFARRLAGGEEDEKGKGNIIRANAYYFDFNAPQAGYYKVRTRIASK